MVISENNSLFQNVANEYGRVDGEGRLIGPAIGKNSSEFSGSGGLSVLLLLATWNSPPR